jgi:hypothetical protein
MQERVKSSPDRTILNLLNRKLEQLEQKKIDLETIRKIETIKKNQLIQLVFCWHENKLK